MEILTGEQKVLVLASRLRVSHEGRLLDISAPLHDSKLFVLLANDDGTDYISHYIPFEAVRDAMKPLVEKAWGPEHPKSQVVGMTRERRDEIEAFIKHGFFGNPYRQHALELLQELKRINP